MAKSRVEAIQEFERAPWAEGKNLIDLGCMQINHHYHGAEFKVGKRDARPTGQRRICRAVSGPTSRSARDLGRWRLRANHAGPNNNPAQKRYVCRVIANLVATGYGGWTPEAKSFCG